MRQRLVFELLNFGLWTIRMRGWFGNGFIALPSNSFQLQVAIFRENTNGDFEVQMLEKPSLLSEHQLQTLRRRTGLALPCRKEPYLPTKRKWNYGWQWLIPINEYRAHARTYGMHILPKEELRKRVGYKEHTHRDPAPHTLHVMPRKQYWGERKRRMQDAWK